MQALKNIIILSHAGVKPKIISHPPPSNNEQCHGEMKIVNVFEIM